MAISQGKRFPWLAVPMLVCWIFVDIAYPPPRGTAAALLALAFYVLAGVGFAWILTYLDVNNRWAIGLAAIAILGNLALAFLMGPVWWVVISSYVMAWGAVGRGIYIFFTEPAED